MVLQEVNERKVVPMKKSVNIRTKYRIVGSDYS